MDDDSEPAPASVATRLGGAVLTGGASTRMGNDKATLEVAGRPMARTVADALAAAGASPVVAVGGDPAALRSIGVDVVPDPEPGRGPVAGVLGALEWFDRHRPPVSHVLVAPCDLPDLTGAALAPLVAAAEAGDSIDVAVAATGRLEPAVAVWSVGARPVVAAALAEEITALHRVLDRLRVVIVAVDPAALRNVNTPDDLQRRPPGAAR